MRWSGHIIRTREKNVYTLLRNLKEKDHLGDSEVDKKVISHLILKINFQPSWWEISLLATRLRKRQSNENRLSFFFPPLSLRNEFHISPYYKLTNKLWMQVNVCLPSETTPGPMPTESVTWTPYLIVRCLSYSCYCEGLPLLHPQRRKTKIYSRNQSNAATLTMVPQFITKYRRSSMFVSEA